MFRVRVFTDLGLMLFSIQIHCVLQFNLGFLSVLLFLLQFGSFRDFFHHGGSFGLVENDEFYIGGNWRESIT